MRAWEARAFWVGWGGELGRASASKAVAMVEILHGHRKRIEDCMVNLDRREQALDVGEDEGEQRQLAADRRYWPERLAQLALELESEPETIRAGYKVKTTRIDPVGLVYLWPVSA